MNRFLVLPIALFGTALYLANSRVPAEAQDKPASEAPAVVAAVYDLKAESLLQRAADRLAKAQSFSGKVKELWIQPALGALPPRVYRSVRTFSMQRPNFVFESQIVEIKNSDGTIRSASALTKKFLSDGKIGVVTNEQQATYQKLDVSSDGFADRFRLNFHEFFDPTRTDAAGVLHDKTEGSLQSLRLLPDETFGGVPCAVIEKKVRVGTNKAGAATARTTKIYVGKDYVIRGYHTEFPAPSGSGETEIRDTEMTNVVLDAVIPASVFAVNLKGYKEIVVPKEPDLLAAGSTAPNFTVYDKDGKAVKLSDFKGKIVVLDFWATWCGPCMASLPHTSELARRKADKDVVVFAVNVWDKKEAFDKWLPAHPEYAPIRFAIDTTPGQDQDVATKLYKVWGIPTQYVIDRDGKIVAGFVVASPSDLEKAIAKADPTVFSTPPASAPPSALQ